MILHWHRARASRGLAGIFGWLWRAATNVGGPAAAGGVVASPSMFDRRRRRILRLHSG